MARKRQSLKHLDYNSPEYWNRLLVQEKLSVSQGEDPRLIYVGGGVELEVIEKYALNSNGRKAPKKPAE